MSTRARFRSWLLASASFTCLVSLHAPTTAALSLRPDDVLVIEVGANRLVRVDPGTGEVAPIAALGADPRDVAIGRDGRVFVTDRLGGVAEVDPGTGSLRAIPTTPSVQFTLAEHIVVAPDGSLLVTGVARPDDGPFCSCIARIDPDTGATQLVSRNGLLQNTRGIAVDPEGIIFVTDNFGVIRIDPVTGDQAQASIVQSVLAHGRGIVLDDRGHFVVAADSGIGDQFDAGVVSIDPATDQETVLFQTSSWTSTPIDLALERDGRILLTDSGVLLRIDPTAGTAVTLAPMGGAWGLAVMPIPEPGTAALVLSGGLAGVAASRFRKRRRERGWARSATAAPHRA